MACCAAVALCLLVRTTLIWVPACSVVISLMVRHICNVCHHCYASFPAFLQGFEPANRSAERRAARVLPDAHEQHAGSRIAPGAGNTAPVLVRHPLLYSRVRALFRCRESLAVNFCWKCVVCTLSVCVASFVPRQFRALARVCLCCPSSCSCFAHVGYVSGRLSLSPLS